MAADDVVYPIPSRVAVFAVIGGLATGGGWLVCGGASASRGIVLLGFIELSPAAAAAFLWVLGLLAIGTGLWCLAYALFRLTTAQQVVLGRDAVAAPGHRWAAGNTVVPYRDVRRATVVSESTAFRIVHAGGVLTIPRSAFATTADQTAFGVELSRRLAAAKR